MFDDRENDYVILGVFQRGESLRARLNNVRVRI